MSRYTTAAKVAAHKEAHPEMYCHAKRCLWNTSHGKACPQHLGKLLQPTPVLCEHCIRTAKSEQSCCPFHYPTEAPYKAQAKRIADAYNRMAEQERRLDLEEQ
jgi:hypothetical protein